MEGLAYAIGIGMAVGLAIGISVGLSKTSELEDFWVDPDEEE